MSWRRKLLFTALALVLAAVLLEGAARVVERVLPPLTVDYGLGFDAASRVFEPDPQRPGMLRTKPSKLRHFVDQRFSARKAADRIRVAVVGGSSVHYLDRELRELAERLSESRRDGRQVEVINAGGRSYGSHRLVLVVDEVLDADLDALVLYTGHNEFEEVEQLHLASPLQSAFERRLSASAFVRVLRDAVARLRARGLERAHDQRLLATDPRPARAWRHPFTDADVQARRRAFEANLRTMVTHAQRRGVPVLLATIPSNLYRPAVPEAAFERYAKAFELYDEGRYGEGAALVASLLPETPGRHQSSRTENDILRRLSRELELPIADVEAAVTAAEPHGVPGERLFLDHCHLNTEGMRVWAHSVEGALRRLLDERPVSPARDAGRGAGRARAPR